MKVNTQIPFKLSSLRPCLSRLVFIALFFLSFLLASGSQKATDREIPASDFTIEWTCELENVKKNTDPMTDSDHIPHAIEEDILLGSKPAIPRSHFREPTSQLRDEVIIPPPELVS